MVSMLAIAHWHCATFGDHLKPMEAFFAHSKTEEVS